MCTVPNSDIFHSTTRCLLDKENTGWESTHTSETPEQNELRLEINKASRSTTGIYMIEMLSTEEGKHTVTRSSGSACWLTELPEGLGLGWPYLQCSYVSVMQSEF